MPRFKPDVLREVGYTLFRAAGCRDEDARTVVDHLVDSNLFGHDSHGAIRFYEYAKVVQDRQLSTNPIAFAPRTDIQFLLSWNICLLIIIKCRVFSDSFRLPSIRIYNLKDN